MKKIRFSQYFLSVALAFISTAEAAKAPSVETLVFVRHAEKPEGGYGQITCQGLNRAIKLPNVLISKYGTPQAIFAPNPSTQVHDKAGYFNYVRPLATIEPTAIRLGLPVMANHGFKDIDGLEKELLDSSYNNALVFVAWEHIKVDKLVRKIVKDKGGDESIVPKWPDSDYDSIFVVKLTSTDNGSTMVTFQHDNQNLNNMEINCPE